MLEGPAPELLEEESASDGYKACSLTRLIWKRQDLVVQGQLFQRVAQPEQPREEHLQLQASQVRPGVEMRGRNGF